MKAALGAVALLVLPGAAPAQEAPAPAAATLVGPGLRTADLDRAIGFYTGMFGMKLATKLQHGPVTEAILCFDPACRGAQLLLLGEAKPGRAVAHGDGLAKIVIRVPDLAALAERLRVAGHAVGPITEAARGYRILNIKDPDGYSLELIQPGAPRG